ncbi:MAG: Type II secretion system protein E [Parcubacteria group bacterium GW2011_GWA2_47_26]|nr:MAG: Type II secretion system protein E [Parcubacteria group bacterium GW2011_GWA2_47_26]
MRHIRSICRKISAKLLPQSKLPDILTKAKLLTPEQIEQWRADAECHNMALEECLFKKRVLKEENLYKAAAAFFGLPFINLKGYAIPPNLLQIIPEQIAIAHQTVPYDYDKETERLKIATLNPEDIQTLEFIEKKTGLAIDLALTDPIGLQDVLKQYRQSLEIELAQYQEPKQAKEEELAQQASVVRIVEALLEHAILQGASDIHIEPHEKDIIVRFRVDGILREAMTLPRNTAPAISARIKILSGLKLDEHRLPQDGRFKVQIPQYHYSVRVSVFPMFDGEKIVMRLLQEDIKVLNLGELGFQPQQQEIIMRAIKKPQGLILVTGPTGSGKTTTLYTGLSLLNRPSVNISTIEDPIEYRIPGVNQSQVNPKIGFTFAIGLRSLLRQDPNIIMVGEIRDSETADIAINAALTGHIVLATLHTNDALTAIPRLTDLGAPSFLIAQTLSLITAQRLVRRICDNCKETYVLGREMAKELEAQFNMPEILDTLVSQGKIKDGRVALEKIRFSKGRGCSLCGGEGYKGRVGVHEVMTISPELSKLIYSKSPLSEMRAVAKKQGFVTLVEDAFIKAIEGLTTIAEILRATKE